MQIDTKHLGIIELNHWMAFLRQYPEDAHLRLAILAAFPIALTPDLLYKIWLNFTPAETRKNHLHRLTIVSDILHSSLCREIGRDLYEMHDDIRTMLTDALHESENGTDTIIRLAKFLRAYVLYNPHKIPSAAFQEAQQWLADSYLEPNKAAQKILGLLKEENANPVAADKVDYFLNWSKQRRHLAAKKTANGSTDILNTTEQFIRGIRDFKNGKVEEAMANLEGIRDLIESDEGDGKGFSTAIPSEVWQAMNGDIPMKKSNANDLIEREISEQTGRLDLSRCGLTKIPEAVFEMTWLNELILRHEYYDWNNNERYSSPNKGINNRFDVLPANISKLKDLTVLILPEGNIQDLSPLKNTLLLTHLDFRDNQVTDLSPLDELFALKYLTFRSNQVRDLSPLENLVNISYLTFWGNQIEDLTPLRRLKDLSHLNIGTNLISNITPISDLSKLNYLDARNNQITDITPLIGMMERGIPIVMEPQWQADRRNINLYGNNGIEGKLIGLINGDYQGEILVHLKENKENLKNQNTSNFISKFCWFIDISLENSQDMFSNIQMQQNNISITDDPFEENKIKAAINRLRDTGFEIVDLDMELVSLTDEEKLRQIISHSTERPKVFISIRLDASFVLTKAQSENGTTLYSSYNHVNRKLTGQLLAYIFHSRLKENSEIQSATILEDPNNVFLQELEEAEIIGIASSIQATSQPNLVSDFETFIADILGDAIGEAEGRFDNIYTQPQVDETALFDFLKLENHLEPNEKPEGSFRLNTTLRENSWMVKTANDVYFIRVNNSSNGTSIEMVQKMSREAAVAFIEIENLKIGNAVSIGNWENSWVYSNLLFENEAILKQKLTKFLKIEIITHSLFIGVEKYEHYPYCFEAGNDLQRLKEVLIQQYGFPEADRYCTVIRDEDATRKNIMNAFRGLRQKVKANDRVLIYYVGHSYMDKDTNLSYWIPTEANQGEDLLASLISESDIKDTIKDINSKHTLLISDSIYSGVMVTRAARPQQNNFDEWEKDRSRWAFYSGRDSLEQEGNGDGASFTFKIIEILINQYDDKINIDALANQAIRQMNDFGNQPPYIGPIHGAGHDGGQFVFTKTAYQLDAQYQRKLIEEGKLEMVFDNLLYWVREQRELSDLEKELIGLAGRFNRLEGDVNVGIVAKEREDMERNKIIAGLLKLLQEVGDLES